MAAGNQLSYTPLSNFYFTIFKKIYQSKIKKSSLIKKDDFS